jgi:hypothetical protein
MKKKKVKYDYLAGEITPKIPNTFCHKLAFMFGRQLEDVITFILRGEINIPQFHCRI